MISCVNGKSFRSRSTSLGFLLMLKWQMQSHSEHCTVILLNPVVGIANYLPLFEMVIVHNYHLSIFMIFLVTMTIRCTQGTILKQLHF